MHLYHWKQYNFIKMTNSLKLHPPPPLSHSHSSQWICAYLKLFPSCICTFQEQINDYIYFTVIHGLYNVLVQ